MMVSSLYAGVVSFWHNDSKSAGANCSDGRSVMVYFEDNGQKCTNGQYNTKCDNWSARSAAEWACNN